MKRTNCAGSQMTTNQDEITCKEVLNREADKITREIINAETYFIGCSITHANSTFIDCDALQAAKEEETRNIMKNQTYSKIIEVA